MKDVNIILGRFMPFHLGHCSIPEAMFNENGLPTVICQIQNKKIDKKHPFTDDLINKEFYKCLKGQKWYADHILVSSADIVKIGQELNNKGYIPHLWGCGTDRKVPFERMAKNTKYREEGMLPDDFKVFVVKRDDASNDIAGISATKVRDAITADNKEAFVKMMPQGAESLYNEFKCQLSKVNESMMSLKDYVVYFTNIIDLD